MLAGDLLFSMAEPAKESGLQEYIDAEIVIEDLKTPTQEKTLCDTLEKLKGVHNVTIKNEKVSVQYEPVRLTEKAIVAASTVQFPREENVKRAQHCHHDRSERIRAKWRDLVSARSRKQQNSARLLPLHAAE